MAVLRRAVEEVGLRGTETMEMIKKKKAKDLLKTERALFPYNLLLCCGMSPNPVKKKALTLIFLPNFDSRVHLETSCCVKIAMKAQYCPKWKTFQGCVK